MRKGERPIFDPGAEDPTSPEDLSDKLKSEMGKGYQDFADRKKGELTTEKSEEEKISDLIEAANELKLKPGKRDQWRRMVEIRVKDLYGGSEVRGVIEVIRALDSGSTKEEVEKMLNDQNHSGGGYGMLRSIVSDFSQAGESFFADLKRDAIRDDINSRE